MSVTYSAGVFFGAYVPHDGDIGKKLERYIDIHGGTPARTEVSGVVVSVVGGESDGRMWTIVAIKETIVSYGHRDGECPDPSMLTEHVGYRAALKHILDNVGASDYPVGWHFYGSVW